VEIISSQILDTLYKIPFGYPAQRFGYALGIDRMTRNNALILNHGGGGFGFLSFMMWYPKFGFGVVTLSNSTNHSLQYEIANGIGDELVAYQKKKLGINNEKPVSGFPAQEKIRTLSTEPGPDKTEWKKWIGSYRFYIFGVPAWREKIKIRNGYLHYGQQQLEEIESGLFFTADGEALDFRGEIPTFRNIRLERIKFSKLETGVVLFSVVCFLLFLTGIPIVSLNTRNKHKETRLPLFYSVISWMTGLLGLAYAFLLLFYIPFILGFAWPWHPLYPADIKMVWLLPHVWLVLCLVLVVFTLSTKSKKYTNKKTRLFYRMLIMGAITFLFLLMYWKQLSFAI
jgi:hypothetical protein